jgi:tRNA modification GTPase
MIRASGPDVPGIIEKFFIGAPRIHGCSPALFSFPGELGLHALPVLVARYLRPNSYTGEDTLEVFLPGNPTLVERILRALTSLEGVRPAEPGEFTARAYFAGRLSLAQAEGVAAAIAALNTEQLDAARSLLQGRTGSLYDQWADELTTLLALVEAGIDFTDQEDVRAIDPNTLRSRLASLASAVASHLGCTAGERVPQPEPLVALVGRPNAGKSTLFNALLARPRAVVFPEAGTTRDVLIEQLDLSGAAPGCGTVLLADLPGLEHAPVSCADTQAQLAARQALARADVLLWCDPTGQFPPDASPSSHARLIRVRTFADRISTTHAGDVEVCAIDGWNLDELRRLIAHAVSSSQAAPLAALLPRHRTEMHNALHHLEEARLAIDPGQPRLARSEEIAQSLRAALDHIGELAGRIDPDDVLGKVFATFCIGK